MKLKQTKDNSNTLGVNEKREFSIDTSNQMIVSILRDRLYKNKIGAVCREVSSNCRDANREAGRELIPINIEIGAGCSLLDEEKLFVSFGDSGIGINPDRIENVFLKYGSSTKRDSNNQTGGFGIGAKTPFAYNNEFIIETVTEFQGSIKKYIYQAIILTENGVESSQLILISEKESEEKLGTKIIVPINSDDRESFEKEIFTSTCFWDVRPNYKGFASSTDVKYKELFKGDNWKVLNSGWGNLTQKFKEISHQEFFILVDGIPYENPGVPYTDTLTYEAITRYSYVSKRTHPILEFKTGELTLSASREEIEELDDNLNLILERILKMEKEILLKGEEMFKKQKTKLDKVSFLNSIKKQTDNNPATNYLNSLKFHENIESIKDLPTTYASLFGTKSTNIHLLYNTLQVRCVKKNKIAELGISSISVSDMKSWNIIIKPTYERMNYKKSETLRQENKSILFVGCNDYDSEEMKKGLKLLKEAGIKVTKYSDVIETKIKRNYTSSKNKTKQERDIRTLYARELGLYSGWNKESFKYNKVTNEISCVEGEFDKTIFLNIKGYKDLKDLDLVSINYDSVFDGELSEEYEDIKIQHLLSFLKTLDYRIIAVKNVDITKNLKSNQNINNTIKALLKEKEIRQYLRAKIKEDYFNNLTSLNVDSSDYKKYNTKMGKAYLKLANFNLNNYKVVDKNKVKSYSIKDNPSLKENKYVKIADDNFHNRNTLTSLANIIKDEFKMKKFDGYLTAEILEQQQEAISKTHPAIHYLWSEVDVSYSWNFSDYDKKDSDRDKGLEIMKKDLLKLILQILK